MNHRDRKALIQTVIGCVCALGLIVLGYFSLDPTMSLGWPVAGAIVITIAMLLGKLDELTDLVVAWMERSDPRHSDDDQ